MLKKRESTRDLNKVNIFKIKSLFIEIFIFLRLYFA